MSEQSVHFRSKKVPTLYESDESKYVGPQRWQVQAWARLVRRAFRHHGYTRWLNQACSNLSIQGLENLQDLNGPCVFVANHQSHLDTLVVQAALPEAIKRRIYFGAAQDRWFVRGKKKLVLQPWYQSLVLGNFPILRGGGKRALSYANWLLAKQQHVFLFPEGTRAMDGELGEFKHGATLLALENNVPIVPIYLAGLNSIRPKGAREVKPGEAGVHFLPPMHFTTNMKPNLATNWVRDRMLAIHRQYQGEVWSEAA